MGEHDLERLDKYLELVKLAAKVVSDKFDITIIKINVGRGEVYVDTTLPKFTIDWCGEATASIEVDANVHDIEDVLEVARKLNDVVEELCPVNLGSEDSEESGNAL